MEGHGQAYRDLQILANAGIYLDDIVDDEADREVDDQGPSEEPSGELSELKRLLTEWDE